MNNLGDLISEIKTPHFFRDIIYFIGGLLFLLVLNYYYSPDLKELPNIELFDGFGIYLILFTVSYVTGRLLVVGSDIYLATIDWLFVKDKRKKLNDGFEELITYKSSKKRLIPDKKPTIQFIEISEAIQKNPHLFNILERNNYQILFLHIFLGITFFLTARISSYFFVLILVITIMIKIRDMKRTRSITDIAEFLSKNK